MRYGGFTPHPPMPSKFEKTRPDAKSPGTYCKVISSGQEPPLSHLCKIPSPTSGPNKGMKIVRKALSGAIARHSGDGKFYAMPHNGSSGPGLTSDTSFKPVRESDPRKF